MINPIAGITAVLGALSGALGGWRWMQRRYGLRPEAARKGVHVTMGVVVLAFPWLFGALWPVIVLSALAFGVLAAIRTTRPDVGGVLHDVGRDSWGELCFPVAVVVMFWLAGGEAVRYGIPILLLALADPAAALIGVRHGRKPYDTATGDTKSREGSLGFFVVAFLCVHVPLLLFTETGRAETLLVSLIVAFVAALIEGVAWRGLDNLLVPLGAFAALETHLPMDASALAIRLVVISGVFAAAALWRKHTTLRGAAVLCVALVGVATWVVGGWLWLAAPAVTYFSYALLWPSGRHAGAERVHTARHVLSVTSVGVGWLLLAAATGTPALLYPYTLAYAGYLALIGVERFGERRGAFSAAHVWGSSTLKSSATLLVALLIVEGVEPHVVVYGAGALVSAGLAAGIYARFQSFFDEWERDNVTRLLRALLVMSTSALGLLVLWMIGRL